MVLDPEEAILFFGKWLYKEGLPYTSTRDIGFSLTGLAGSAGKTAQVEATINTVPEAGWAIADAVMEKKTMARGLGLERAVHSMATTCNVDDWILGLDKGTSEDVLEEVLE